MTSQQYNTALRVSTQAAMQAGLSLPEIIGNLELAKINVERMAYQHAMAQVGKPPVIMKRYDLSKPDVGQPNGNPDSIV